MSKKQLQEVVILLLDVIAKYPFIVFDKVLLKHLEQALPSKNKQTKKEKEITNG